MPEPEELSLVDAILDLQRADPSEPFAVVMASGDKYRIEYPDNFVEMRSQFLYVSPRPEKVLFMRKSQILATEKTPVARSRSRRRRAS